MEHIVFFEPRYQEQASDIWNIRGGYKYGSIVGNLQTNAKLTVLMSSIPPPDNPHRKRLETEFGMNFKSFATDDNQDPAFADYLASDLAAALEDLGATILSNLNGRGVGYQYAMARAARTAGVRYVMRVAGNDIESRGKVAEMRRQPFWGTERLSGALRQERVANHLADTIIVMSNRERARLMAMTADANKINVCFRGVDQSHFYPRADLSKRCRKFLFVGRRSHEKGYDILEAATNQLRFDDEEAVVSFAGTFEPGRYGLRNYIGFVKYDQLADLYRDHDALVLCSRSEGFPQVLMEAMSCALPCIITRHLFEHEFRHGVDCLLVEPDAKSVASAMTRLYDDEGLFQSLRSEVIALARRQYSEVDNQSLYHRLLLTGNEG